MNNWKPKTGDYIVFGNCLHVICRVLSDNDIIIQDSRETLPPHKIKIKDNMALNKPIRLAVLDNFAVVLPNFGACWFVEKDSEIIIYDDPETLTCFKKEHFLKGISESLYKDILTATIEKYNITVMPESLWQELRK